MAVLGDVVVLKAWLQMDALVLNSGLVLIEDLVDLRVRVRLVQILAAGKQSVVGGDGGHTRSRCLIDALDREGAVHVVAEGRILEEAFRIISLVLLGQGLELIVRQGEVKLREDGFELWAGDASLTQLVEILEKVPNADALHYNSGLESVLDVGRIVRDVDVGLHEAVVDNINLGSVIPEEGADLLGANTNLLESLWLGSLGLVGGEHVLRAINVLAEVKVVDLLCVATVAVTADNQVVHLLAWWHNVESLEDTKELLGCDVLRV